MTKHFERDISSLEQDLLSQSSMVEEMIRLACRALCDRKPGISDELAQRESRVNGREVIIEEECLKMLALHQPVAIDLRRITTILKVNSDLERIADLAVNIGERNDALSVNVNLQLPSILEPMADKTTEMVRDALDAFVDSDSELARRVCQKDDEVDAYNRRLIDEVYDLIQENPQQVVPALHLFSASRHIERIADHATNIAEDVIYLVEGEITRHRHEFQRPT